MVTGSSEIPAASVRIGHDLQVDHDEEEDACEGGVDGNVTM